MQNAETMVQGHLLRSNIPHESLSRGRKVHLQTVIIASKMIRAEVEQKKEHGHGVDDAR